MESQFSSAHIFPDSLKVFGFLVTLLYRIGKKVIFQSFRFSVTILFRVSFCFVVWCIPNTYTYTYLRQFDVVNAPYMVWCIQNTYTDIYFRQFDEPSFVIFKPLSYCFEETIGFDVKASFACRPVSRLIRWYNKPGNITKEFWEKAI